MSTGFSGSSQDAKVEAPELEIPRVYSVLLNRAQSVANLAEEVEKRLVMVLRVPPASSEKEPLEKGWDTPLGVNLGDVVTILKKADNRLMGILQNLAL